MKRMIELPDDFEGEVRILSEREGGRKSPPYNGIRWDFRYFFQTDLEAWMIWPEFVDDLGDMLPPDRPVVGFVKARFYIINPELRAFHRQHARAGVGFFCVEGPRVCAAGVITRLTGLAGVPNP